MFNGLEIHVHKACQHDGRCFASGWGDPAFDLPEFEGMAGSVSGASGLVTLDATDPNRIQVTVLIRWLSEGSLRQLTLPFTVTEMKP